MTDLERLLRDSLTDVGERYEPSDPIAARAAFLARRRTRTLLWGSAGALVAAAAAVVLVVFWTAEPPPTRRIPVASQRTDAVVTARIDVGPGARPSGLAAGAGYVWVANSGSKTVSAVDPATNRVVRQIKIPFEGDPDDVAVRGGSVWVVSDAGELARIEPDTGAQVGAVQTIAADRHLDIASGPEDDVWLLASGGDAYRIDAATGEVSTTLPGGRNTTDISVAGDAAWMYDRASGTVASYDLATERELTTTDVGRSRYADLGAGDGFTWFYRGSDGVLLQIEQATGTVLAEHPLGGTFGAISIGPEDVYALVVEGGPEGSGEGRLFRFDATTSTRIGRTVELTDTPFDVDQSDDAIWVTSNSADALTRIELVPKGTTPSPSPTPQVAAPEGVLYFVADGDIYLQRRSGAFERVTDTRAPESSPTVAPDGSALVFQRGDGMRADIVYLGLTDTAIYPPGDEVPLAKGAAPSFAPDGRLAWARTPRMGHTLVSIGTIGTDDLLEFPVDSGLGPYQIDDISWTSDSSAILFHAAYEWHSIYRASIPPPAGEASDVALEEITPAVEDTAFVSPATFRDEPWAVALCCGTYPEWGDLTTADLGVVGDGGFSKVIGLDDLGLAPSFEFRAVPAGGLDFEGGSGWERTDKPTWFVFDGTSTWLVNVETREADTLEPAGITDIAVIPGAASSRP